MMTNGPAASLGGILHVPFSRPRDRKQVIEHPNYYELREQLIGFLEEHAVRETTIAGNDDQAVLQAEQRSSDPDPLAAGVAAAPTATGAGATANN